MLPLALLSYSTDNLGDDIQSIALHHFWPSSAEPIYIDRDQLGFYTGPEAKLVVHGWYGQMEPGAWPPAPQLNCLATSIHVSPAAQPIFSTPESLAWLKRQRVIGCRDHATLQFMRSLGVEAYVSGCVTTTLARLNWPIDCTTTPIIVDLPKATHERLPMWLRNLAEYGTHRTALRSPQDRPERMRQASRLLAGYRSIRLVITGRLHAALPCAAFRTPHILIKPQPFDRLSGLEDLVNMKNEAGLPANLDLFNSCPAHTGRMMAHYGDIMHERLQRFWNAA